MFLLRHNPAFYHGIFEPSTVLMAPNTPAPSAIEGEEEPQATKKVYRSIEADAHENADQFSVTMDLPGVRSDKLTVQVEGGVLSISADRTTANGSVVAYRQKFSLDEDMVDVDNVKATLADGVLTLTLQKKEEAKPMDVPIIEGEVMGSTDEEMRITFDVPGVKAVDLNAVVHNGILTIKGERKKGNSLSHIQRSMTLDRHRTDLTQLKAYLAQGVLTFTAPQKKVDSKTINLAGEGRPKHNVLIENATEATATA